MVGGLPAPPAPASRRLRKAEATLEFTGLSSSIRLTRPLQLGTPGPQAAWKLHGAVGRLEPKICCCWTRRWLGLDPGRRCVQGDRTGAPNPGSGASTIVIVEHIMEVILSLARTRGVGFSTRERFNRSRPRRGAVVDDQAVDRGPIWEHHMRAGYGCESKGERANLGSDGSRSGHEHARPGYPSPTFWSAMGDLVGRSPTSP